LDNARPSSALDAEAFNSLFYPFLSFLSFLRLFGNSPHLIYYDGILCSVWRRIRMLSHVVLLGQSYACVSGGEGSVVTIPVSFPPFAATDRVFPWKSVYPSICFTLLQHTPSDQLVSIPISFGACCAATDGSGVGEAYVSRLHGISPLD